MYTVYSGSGGGSGFTSFFSTIFCSTMHWQSGAPHWQGSVCFVPRGQVQCFSSTTTGVSGSGVCSTCVPMFDASPFGVLR